MSLYLPKSRMNSLNKLEVKLISVLNSFKVPSKSSVLLIFNSTFLFGSSPYLVDFQIKSSEFEIDHQDEIVWVPIASGNSLYFLNL